jgi:hypothetical protein
MNPGAGAMSVRIETIWNQIWIGGITREGGPPPSQATYIQMLRGNSDLIEGRGHFLERLNRWGSIDQSL